MVIHGGFWRVRYNLLHASHMCAALATAGLVVANLEYRRVGEPGGGWPGSLEDVYRAYDHFSNSLGTSPVVLGHSAGGHLALRMAVDRSPEGVLALAPVADLQMAFELNLSNGAAAAFVGGTPASAPQLLNEADPRLHASSVRRVLLHGSHDDIVPLALSESFAVARGNDQGHVSVTELQGADHFDLIDPESAFWATVVENTLRLLG